MNKYTKYLIILIFLSISWMSLFLGVESGAKSSGEIMIYNIIHSNGIMYYYSIEYYIMFYLTFALIFIFEQKENHIYIAKRTRKEIAQKKVLNTFISVGKIVGMILFVDLFFSFVFFPQNIIFKYMLKVLLQNVLLTLFIFLNATGVLIVFNKFKIKKMELIYLLIPLEFMISKKFPELFYPLFVINTSYSNIMYSIIFLTCISIFLASGYYYQESRKDYV